VPTERDDAQRGRRCGGRGRSPLSGAGRP
jgi:hypothetical protein